MSGERGATLMETLVALAITALLAATAAQVAGFGLTSIERAEAASARAAGDEIARRVVTDALARAAPAEAGAGALSGDGSAARWFGAGLDGEGRPRVGWWRLSAAGALSPCPGDTDIDCGAAVATLGLADAALSYVGADGAARDTWAEDVSPHLVRITHDAGVFAVAPRAGGVR